MSGGADAVAGFVFQKDYAAFRFLGSEAMRLLVPGDISHCIASFKIEGRSSADGEVWDVSWTAENGKIDLRECKDTEITFEDRKKFYLRVRSEIASGTDPSQLRIGWVVDPGKQGRILFHFGQMASLAAGADTPERLEPPSRVNSPLDALQEALYYLSHHECATTPPIPTNVARTLLSKLAVDRFSATELSTLVEMIASTLFQSGTGLTIREFLQGKLATTIQRERKAEFTREDFLGHLRTSQLTLALHDELSEILAFHSAAGNARHHPGIKGIIWACRPDRTPKLWPLEERLNGYDSNGSCVLIARTGVGKTTTTWQMFREQAAIRNKHHVLHVEAGNASKGTVKLLPRLCGLLSGVSRSWVAIDGIDQIEKELKPEWSQTLSWLLRIPQLTVVITARHEVLIAHGWMKDLLSTLKEIPLSELSREQIIAEFKDARLPAPNNLTLLECLKNPFLFSLYAQAVSDDELPLSDRGDVTAFDVIELYWRHRVMSDSQGFRAAGVQHSSASKRAAAMYLADQTLNGDLVIERPTNSEFIALGIETLCYEGVLDEAGTATVAWSHTWLREYAVIERLVGKLETRSAIALAKAVGILQVDHAARLAAIGGCKWIVSHPEVGRVEDYLRVLYEVRQGLAREALAVLIEGSTRYLTLAILSPGLLIEALTFAREMRAPQWREQIESLPEALFQGPHGPDLNLAAFLYDAEMTTNE